jgi:hypothetical protein
MGEVKKKKLKNRGFKVGDATKLVELTSAKIEIVTLSLEGQQQFVEALIDPPLR